MGQLTTASGGVISGGQFDSVQDGGSPVSGTFTAGSYTAASNGRAVVSLTPSVGNRISRNLLGGKPVAGLLYHQ